MYEEFILMKNIVLEKKEVVSEVGLYSPQDWNMDESLGGMIKLIGPNYSAWKSKMWDMPVCENLWLPV